MSPVRWGQVLLIIRIYLLSFEARNTLRAEGKDRALGMPGGDGKDRLRFSSWVLWCMEIGCGSGHRLSGEGWMWDQAGHSFGCSSNFEVLSVIGDRGWCTRLQTSARVGWEACPRQGWAWCQAHTYQLQPWARPAGTHLGSWESNGAFDAWISLWRRNKEPVMSS